MGEEGGSFAVWGLGKFLAYAIIFPFVLVGINYLHSERFDLHSEYRVPEKLEYPDYDVNGDGCNDFIHPDGRVSLRKKNGGYVSLEKHIENLSDEVKDSYKLEKSDDGLYRTVGSGYVSGIEKGLEGGGD